MLLGFAWTSSAASPLSILFLLLVNLCFNMVKSSIHDINDKCKICQFLSKSFSEGLEKTEKLHFGGGNTDWEERKLGKFKTSETRFVEIMDYVCKKDSLTDTIGYSGIKDYQFKCHSLVESHEEVLERWFFDHQDDGPSLEAFLCTEKLKFCCEDGYFGDNCSPCPGMKQSGKPCFGNGRCQGNGSRAGNGTCSCDAGFVGKMCSNCDSAYFAVLQNSTHIECDECFAGCSGGCVGASPKDCRECRIGYKMDTEIGCNDIDECVEAGKCPNAAEQCVNTPGSFECQCIDGFKRSDSGECVVDVVAHPNVPWLQPAEKLRLISYSSLFLITVFVFTVHRSTSTVFLTVSTIFAALLIDYFFGNGILHLFRHFLSGLSSKVNVDKTSDETNSSNSVELEANDELKNTDEEKVQQANDEL